MQCRLPTASIFAVGIDQHDFHSAAGHYVPKGSDAVGDAVKILAQLGNLGANLIELFSMVVHAAMLRMANKPDDKNTRGMGQKTGKSAGGRTRQFASRKPRVSR